MTKLFKSRIDVITDLEMCIWNINLTERKFCNSIVSGDYEQQLNIEKELGKYYNQFKQLSQ
jgi:hypothetical protein